MDGRNATCSSKVVVLLVVGRCRRCQCWLVVVVVGVFVLVVAKHWDADDASSVFLVILLLFFFVLSLSSEVSANSIPNI